MRTVLEVIELGTDYLEKAGVPEARANIQWLVGHHLGLSRMQLYLNFDRPLSDEELAPIRVDLKKRSQRVPLQHLIGSVEFHRREYKCDGRALIPRPETEELVSLILCETVSSPTRLLDVGTGTGIIGLTLAMELPAVSEAVLADFSTDALALASENSAALGVDCTFVESDLFSGVDGQFDLIVANLPYVPEQTRSELEPELTHDPDLALFSGDDGMDLLRRFIREVPGYLAPGGLLALEIGHDQSDEVAGLLRQAGLAEISAKSDLSGIPRFPFARKP